MNVRLSLGVVWKSAKRMRSTGCCMVFLGMLAGAGCTGFAMAEDAAATQTTLAVATSNEGARTRATLTAHVTAPDHESAPSGVVTFRSAETELGSALLNREGDASLQTDILAAGDHQVVAVYQGQPGYVTSVSKAELLHAYVSTVAGFTVAASPTSLSTAVGGFVSSVVTVTPNNGFNGYVSLSCNGLPVNTTCTFTPVSVPALCTSSTACPAGSSVMQIQTLAPSPSAAASNPGDTGLRRFALVLPVLGGMLGLGAGRRRVWRNLALGMLCFAGVMGMTACSQRYRYLNHGPPDNPGTPLGSYTIIVHSQSSTGSQTTLPPTSPSITLKITG